MKKKQTIKSILLLNALISLLLTIPIVYWADILSESISFQKAEVTGSYNSEISFSTWSTNFHTSYINAWNNSTIIWNYFTGYYYDSVFWFFQLDWSSNPEKNVRIFSSTDECPTGYWYKLWWKAFSENAWFIDFNYSSDVFVYYCESDSKLHWKAYSKEIGVQNFEWIEFEIITSWDTEAIITNSDVFSNDNTRINIEEVFTWSNSNVSIDEILWEDLKFDQTEESIFYIVK